MKTKLKGMSILLAAVLVTGCGYNLDETAVEMAQESDILLQKESPNSESTMEITTMISNAKAEDFLGEWVYEDIVLYISELDESHYLGYIIFLKNQNNTDVYDSWGYELQYQDGKMICNGKGRRYNSDMITLDQTAEYMNGSAEFILTSEGLLWNDLTEHFGDGMVFEYSETQPAPDF